MHGQLGLQLIVATFCRFLLKTGRRFVYPFAAIVSVGLGVSLAAITMLIAINQIAGLLSPLFGPMGDRWGHRTMIVVGLLLASLSMLMVGILPFYSVLMIALFALGLGIGICDPAIQSFVGKAVPFARRGQVIGLTELAWAASSLIGIPLAGWLIHAYSWNMPFVVLGLLGIVGTMVLRWLLPPDGSPQSSRQPRALLSVCRTMLKQRPAQALLWYAFLASCAGDIFYMTYALWLADSFNMGIGALGLATVAIGIAELGGELLTATLADRLGLRRTMLLTLLATTLCYALLPLWGFSATGALIGIFLLCLAFEFSLIVALSLSTEAMPATRATMMSSFQAVSGMGHVCGVLTGGLIWLTGGIAGVGIVCATLCALGFVVVYRGLQQWPLPIACPTVKLSAENDHRAANHTAVHPFVQYHAIWGHRSW